MNISDKIKDIVKNSLPAEAEVTKTELEGPEVALYTKNPGLFFENSELVAKIAFELKKRVNIRTDKNLLEEEEKTRELIEKIVPQEAKITDIDFNKEFSEVVIESLKPGLVIGKGGETSKEIVLKTGWTPKIIRTPTQPSETLKGIRHHLNKYSKERKDLLKKVSERIYRELPQNGNDWIRLIALGGFQQVGRSCMLIETPHTKTLFDCGINVASYQEPYPYLDALHFPMSDIDAVVISHAHLDHSGFLPYLFKSGYRGPVYCTEPTRDLMALLQFDYIDVLVKEGKEPPYTERDVKEQLKHCITREYREVTDIAPDMRITFHNAAHILGSASVHMHIGEGAHNLVYSADIKNGFTRLFDNIDTKYPRLETLIIESTYGAKGDVMPNRQRTEERFLKVLQEVLEQGGNVLIPVFAVGRGQELMLVIENFYRQGLIKTKCYVDGMTNEASGMHTAYPEYLRQSVKRRILQGDSPFMSEVFEVAEYDKRKEILETGGNIIIASSGMMTGGPSVQYFKMMAEDPRNALIFVGYQGEGSLGRKIQSGVDRIPITDENGKTKALEIKMRIESIEGFSGHSDKNQLVNYVQSLRPSPKRILTDHGEKSKAIGFAQYLGRKFKVNALSMQNLDALRLK